MLKPAWIKASRGIIQSVAQIQIGNVGFNTSYPRDVYVASIMIDRRVEDYLKSSSLSRDQRRDLRYYIDMWAACMLTNKSHPNTADIAACVNGVSMLVDDSLKFMSDFIVALYGKLGGTDKVAKGPELVKEVVAELEKLFPASMETTIASIKKTEGVS